MRWILILERYGTEGRGTVHLLFVKGRLFAAEAALDGILHGDSIRLRAVKGTSGRYRRKRMKTLFVRQELIPQMAGFRITGRQWEGNTMPRFG